MANNRRAEVRRETKETQVSVKLDLDGRGQYDISTGIGMLDHLLEQLARHSRFDLRVEARGDIHRDPHHLVEDVGLALGQALNEALSDRRGIVRFGHAVVPLDESLALVALDLGGRGYAAIEATFNRDEIGGLPMENVGHCLSAFASQARLNLHVQMLAGTNDHHKAEAIFKALARALNNAVRVDPRLPKEIPSTKETL